MKLSIRCFTLIAIAFVFLIFSILEYLFNPFSKFVSIWTLLIPAVFLINFSRNIPVFILFLFIFSYNVDAFKFYFFNVDLTVWPDFKTKDVVNFVLILNAIFIFFMGIFIPSKSQVKYFDFEKLKVPSARIFYFLVLFFLILTFNSIQGESLLESVAYGYASKSPLNEYAIIIFFLILVFKSQSSKIQDILVFVLFLFFVLKNLVYGGRIEILQIFLLVLLTHFILPGRISYLKLFAILIAGIYVNGVIVSFRSDPMLLLEGKGISYFNFITFFEIDQSKEYLNSNQGDVLQASSRIVGLVNEGFISVYDGLLSFGLFFLSLLVPSKFLPDIANLATFMQSSYRSGGGGLISVYSYVWLGFVGPILFGSWIGYSIRSLFLNNSVYFQIYSLFILISFPRWFAYNPLPIIKFSTYPIFLYILLKVFNNYYSVVNRNIKMLK